MVKLKRAEEIGELEICARTARNLSQKVLVGKQSPFVQFNLDSVIKQTVSDKRGGRNPQWSDTIIFPILKDQDKILVTIYNRKSKVQSDYIGEVSIDLLPILKEGEKDAWFPLKDRDDYAGDVYIEFTYYKKGEPRDRNKVNVTSINEIEEGLSILQLKNIRQDPKLNSMELPKDRSINKNTMLNVPNNNQVLRKNTNSSQLSFNSENNDTTPTLANENDLVDILDEIRSLVDYPYQLPAQEAPLGPGALPPMRRKPLPKPPNSNRSSNSQLLTPNSNNLSQNDLLLNNNTQSPTIIEHQLQQEMEFNNNHIPILNTNNNQYSVAHFYQQNNSNSNLTRTPSPAPSSQISELVLGDAMNYQRYLSLTGSNSTASLTRRGSLDSIKTGTTMEDYLDHDPTVEIKFNNSKIPSIKRRPLEAPSILQSQNFYNQRVPYPEDVRGRPLMYYQQHQQQQHQQQLLSLQQMNMVPVPVPLVNNDNTQLTKPLPQLRPIPYPPPSQHHTMIPPPSAHPSHPHHHLSPYTTNLHYPQRPMYHPPTMMEYPPSRFIQQPITNGVGEYSPAPRPMFYSPRALPPPIVSPLIRPHVTQRQLPNPYTNQPRRGSLVD